MSSQELSKAAAEDLVGRVIVKAEKNYIVLDSGTTIYLDDSEIENLNG